MKIIASLIAISALIFQSATAGVAINESFRIPSDAKATYTLLERSKTGRMRSIVTKRDGPSGITYSKREYDCTAQLVRYLGTGDTLNNMKASKPDAKLASIVDGSIASYVGGLACE